jgi:hypothetical protein
VATDPSGELAVADTANQRLELFDPAHQFVAVLGQAGADPGQFMTPTGVAFDTAGNLLVADRDNHRVERLTRGGVWLGNVGASLPADSAGALIAPSAVAVDGQGNIFVADTTTNRIVSFAPDGSLTMVAGGPGSGPGQFSRPAALATDATGNVYVADSGNDRVQELSPSGQAIRMWGGPGSGDGQFHEPDGIAVDAAGDVYVSDRQGNRIEKFSGTGGFIVAWGTRGAADGQLITPAGLTIDCHGTVIVADRGSNRVEAFADVARAVPCAAAGGVPIVPPVALSVKLAGRTGLLRWRAVVLAVRCDRPCTVVTQVRLKAAGGGTHTTMHTSSRRLHAGRTTSIRLSLSPRGVAALRRALGKKRHALLAQITVEARALIPPGGLPVAASDYGATLRATA